jgi:predicted Zn-dependent peptidase
MTDRMAGTALNRSRLGSGLRVVTEQLPGLRSVAVGFWVGTGSRDEPGAVSGVSHFLEHLLFKGTADRTAGDLAEAIESVGGDMNAFTGQECTAYYVRVPDQCLTLALEILSDIVWTPALRTDELESERQVILEEIRMRDDTPDDLVHDVFAGALFPGHALGREVAGSHETIGGMSREAVVDYHRAHYVPDNVVVAVAGNLDDDAVRETVDKLQPRDALARPERPSQPVVQPAEPVAVVERALEQAHLVLGTRALPRDDPDRYALAVVDQVLGGGMSSRLFQEIRERRGLAYSVFSYRSAFADTGAFAVYAATAPEHVDEVLGVIGSELDRLVADGGVSDHELAGAKGHLTGSLALGLESSASRMHRIGRNELTLGEVPSLDDVVARIEAVSTDDIGRVIERVLGDGARTLAAVGPVSASQFA